jgi:hypothetical protein
VKVEFMSKYGAVAELAKLTKRHVLILSPGVFMTEEEWDKIIPDPLRPAEGDDGSVSYMAHTLTITGSLVAIFTTKDECDQWCLQLAAAAINTPILVNTYSPDGEWVGEFQAHEFTIKDPQ